MFVSRLSFEPRTNPYTKWNKIDFASRTSDPKKGKHTQNSATTTMERNDDSSNSHECEIKRRRMSVAEPLEITLLFEVSSDSQSNSTSDSSSDSSSSSSSSSTGSGSTSSLSSDDSEQKIEPNTPNENVKPESTSSAGDTNQEATGSKEIRKQETKTEAGGSETKNDDQTAIEPNSSEQDGNPSGSNAFNPDQFEESAIQSAIDEHGLQHMNNSILAVPSPIPLSSPSDDSQSKDSNEGGGAAAVERTSDYNSSSSDESNHFDFMETAIAAAIQKKGLLPHSVEMTPNG